MMKLRPESCEYYPCHFEGQDCRLCFCPFYPCEEFRTRGKYKKQSCDVIWSCKDCNFIHRKEVADEVIEELLKIGNDRDMLEIRKIFERIFRKHVLDAEKQ